MTKIYPVLRDEIGTAVTNKRSRPDQFLLIIHGHYGQRREGKVH